MVDSNKQPGLVGQFIRQRREALKLSQRALGLKFEPPVTTQFISNVERGVTPLPPAHVATLTRALLIGEAELLQLMEREYSLKVSGKVLGKPSGRTDSGETPGQITVSASDYDFMRQLYDAYRQADEKSRLAFQTVCQSMLKIFVKDSPPVSETIGSPGGLGNLGSGNREPVSE